jgi:enamine deaminase RidA (YjgF/YER057c/UK114 family)
MTALLDPRTADKLARICGMFGSDHIGERAAAAQMADKLLKECGLRWSDVISVPTVLTSFIPTTADQIAFVLRNIGALSMWERGFIYSVNGKRRLSPKQREILSELVAKAKAYAEAA